MDHRQQQHPARAPSWPWSAASHAEAAPAATAGSQASTPAEWVARCTARLAELVQDEGVSADDLRMVAAATAEEAACSVL